MRTGERIALNAMKKEHKRLARVAEKAKTEADEYMAIGSEFIAIHKEFIAIVNSSTYTKEQIKKLKDLQKRRDRVERIRKKDLIKLLDKQSAAECEVEALGQEIEMLNFRYQIRESHSK